MVDGVDTAFPVNAVAYHAGHGTFATGGADGLVYMWDGVKKKRICTLRKCESSVAALAFSASGEHLAIAASYAFEHGERQHAPDAIICRRVADAEVAPKAPKPKPVV